MSPVSDVRVVVVAGGVVAGVWTGDARVALLLSFLGLGATLPSGRVGLVVVGVLAPLVGVVRSEQAWDALAPDELGPVVGWVRVVDDPQPYRSSTRVVVEVAGERFEVWSRGRAQQQRVRSWRGGWWVALAGERVPLDDQRARRVAWQHVVGEVRPVWLGDVSLGDPVSRASNRVRAAVERAAARLPERDGALFRGLVIGDDRDQPSAMIERFRSSGLSHLTAVSGQNVAFVLAACGPLLRRLRTWPRLAVTLAVIAWFVTLTRFEPSIVRAGAMAGLAAVAFATGRDGAPLRLLALAVGGLVIVDPLLVWSVGFWLSVGATAGVCAPGPWLASRLSFLGPLALPVGITLGAQLGVAVPSVLVFGRLPLVSVPANLLAVPVAGAVMLYGLPAALLAGSVGWLAPAVMAPAGIGTRWVDTVAALGARLEPGATGQLVGWSATVFGVAVVVVSAGRRGKNRSVDDDPAADR